MAAPGSSPPGSRPNPFAFVARPPSGPERCSCGTDFRAGGPRSEFRGAPEAIATLFLGRGFCTAQCADAFLLEAIEFADSVPAGALLDAEEFRNGLRVLRAELRAG